eukprot:225033-Amphidinium_carterae.3
MKIRVLSRAPPESGKADPDDVGIKAWRAAAYCTGDTPAFGFNLIKHMVQFKLVKGDCHRAPALLTLTAATGATAVKADDNQDGQMASDG